MNNFGYNSDFIQLHQIVEETSCNNIIQIWTIVCFWPILAADWIWFFLLGDLGLEPPNSALKELGKCPAGETDYVWLPR